MLDSVSDRPVLIYRDRLLAYSETFIPAQAESLQRYQGYYVGVSRQSGWEALPGDRFCLLEDQVRWPAWGKAQLKLLQHPPRAFLRLLQGRSPQLLHAHFGPDAVQALPIARRLGIPLVVTFHGYDAALQLPAQRRTPWGDLHQLLYHRGTYYKYRYIRQRQQLFAEAAQVIAVSDCIRSHLLAQGCPPEKVTTHYIGIDLQQFQPEPLLPREPVVLFVGRLVEKKGCTYLLQAMEAVQQRYPDVKVVIIGEGKLRSQLEKQAQQSGVQAEFLGRQPASAVRYWMNRAALFCVPSVTTPQGDLEGLGMVFAEAQAMELPVVSFASGGIREVVRHHETGLLVPERAVAELSRAIERLLAQPELRRSMGLAGRVHVTQRFDLAINTAHLEEIYDQILDPILKVESISSSQPMRTAVAP